ncbi:EspA/EspE family type VII secretion system effector [Mycobacterium kansasii]|uniref:ESX-1 secretion-associated protein EspA/EspE-like domain-containing protein n=3 Tax=Mycobacterium kansasii TaxID=1768 RepID=A0A1V3WK03_MYCKA|nr:EspA/EspE family type VII secretion system effector [Mycobacterium kansasii]ARG54780.1 hypothetical protein B1T43_01650 [Mycobacterium kansasii]ARG60232.1 hypothetical protein B1T45_01655 [Mycobacterium kansasii]ARG67967.1 hypothetical protein B1T47_01750 [Mycobacterium kansasii]ARG77519.1 hypothetical protein B1T51_27070 [Mycobacterium kansasii]ARG83004.1 hypothetical protein B1T52_27165 [Mycobacterium kansasii]
MFSGIEELITDFVDAMVEEAEFAANLNPENVGWAAHHGPWPFQQNGNQPPPAPAPQEQVRDTSERGSVICAETEVLLGVVLALLGQGRPDPGDRLVASRSMFNEVSAQIEALVPGGGWQGSAAQAYVAHNLAQSQRAKLMRDLDHLAADLVSAQGDLVEKIRYFVIALLGGVGLLGAYCFYLEQFEGAPGRLLSLQIASLMFLFVITSLLSVLGFFAIATYRNASNLQAATQRLTHMVTTLPSLSDTNPRLPDAPFPPADPRSEFDAAEHSLVSPVAGLPDDKAPTAETPDVSLAFADLPGSPEFSMPTLPSPGFPDFGAPHLPIPTLAGLAILPTADELAALPDLSGALAGEPGLANLSTMAQLAAPLSQLSGLSGAAGGLSQLTNIAGQQAQMISSLAQQGAQQHAALADQVRKDDHNDGAAAGTTTTEPAPVDAATGSAPQPRHHVR